MPRKAKASQARWVRRLGVRRAFLLKTSAGLLASLRWTKLFGSLAAVTIGDHEYSLKRVGFFRPRVSVRIAGSESDFADFRPDF